MVKVADHTDAASYTDVRDHAWIHSRQEYDALHKRSVEVGGHACAEVGGGGARCQTHLLLLVVGWCQQAWVAGATTRLMHELSPAENLAHWLLSAANVAPPLDRRHRPRARPQPPPVRRAPSIFSATAPVLLGRARRHLHPPWPAAHPNHPSLAHPPQPPSGGSCCPAPAPSPPPTPTPPPQEPDAFWRELALRDFHWHTLPREQHISSK